MRIRACSEAVQIIKSACGKIRHCKKNVADTRVSLRCLQTADLMHATVQRYAKLQAGAENPCIESTMSTMAR